MEKVLFVLLLGLGVPALGADGLSIKTEKALMDRCFLQAARRWNVPETLLRAIALSETGGFHNIPSESNSGPGGHPKFYGIMGLRDDDVLGHTLQDAARILRVEKGLVARDLCKNIEGAAALISNQIKVREKDPDYVSALTAYWGLGSATEAAPFMDELVYYLDNGYRTGRLDLSPDKALSNNLKQRFFRETGTNVGQKAPKAGAEYPGADWDATPNFDANAARQLYVVLHTTEGSFNGAVSWLKNPKSSASAHYIVRRRDGYVKQLVKEKDRAWHARCWNAYTIAIEMEGFLKDKDTYTPELYASVAKIVKYLAVKHKIAKNNMHIVGHNFWATERFKKSTHLKSCNDHGDPGPNFEWEKFFGLLSSSK